MSELPVLHLGAGLPGFPGAHHWVLVEIDGDGPFRLLRSVDIDDLELLVTAPHAFFPDWGFELPDHEAVRIGLTDATDALVLAIVTTGETPQDATANLLAPLVVNLRTLEGAQVVLEEELDQLRRPLFPALVAA